MAAPSAGRKPTRGDREFAYGRRDFERVRELILRCAGITLAPHKADMVYSRLVKRLRATGTSSVEEYLDRVEREGGEELQAFTNALTTNLTAFYREAHHFDRLREHLASLPRGERASIWCAAASTGEEPYTLAITACEAFGSLRPPVRILATDIDTQVLEHGQQGIYALDRIESIGAERRRRFFRRGVGANEGYCRVIDELRALVTFQPLNLLDAHWPLRGPFDAIFCRNVMIYFDKPTQYRILRRIVPLLGPGGLFFSGHSESFYHAADLLRACGRTVYRRADTAASAA